MVNDAILESQAWLEIRRVLMSWLKNHTSERDQIYVVHISNRPELVVPPTQNKVMVQAGIESLTPKAELENYFTVRYLIDGLTHLPEHQTLPHQVLLITDQLSNELKQLEDLLSTLRRTGLQIYNLEFPYEFTPESEQRFQETRSDPTLAMKVQEDRDQWMRSATRDNFQEERNVQSGFSIPIGGKSQERDAERERILNEAFHEAFTSSWVP